MKFPLLTNAFGHQKMILEIGGNAVGVSDPSYQPQQHRRRRVDPSSAVYQTAARRTESQVGRARI